MAGAVSAEGINIERLRSWIGREEVVEEPISPTPARMLAATLDHDDPLPRVGDPIAPLAHWTHLVSAHRQSDLSENGHAALGAFMPPVPLERRMFAGARISFLKPIRIGEPARRTARLVDLACKRGRSGLLVFALVRQEIEGREGVLLVEEQDIVYREAPRSEEAAPPSEPPPAAPERRREYLPNEAMLFRYSALIFNAHRIHYDRPFTVGLEGYPRLVVHGQLVATCLADLAHREWGRPLAAFSFRARRPLFDGSRFSANGTAQGGGVDLWACDAEGAVAMTARAEFA